MTADPTSATSLLATEDAVERGAAALCRFVFPGYLVPRLEMARAVLAAAADEGEDWMERLPDPYPIKGTPDA